VANKTHHSKKHSGLRTSVLAVASCLALSGVALDSQAAGLGRLVVFSALGQPLRAEIEVTATRDELADMKAKLASPEAFKQAGLDYATTLLSIRFNLERRPGGQAVIKLSSDRPINDPFVDMLMELNWASGRLVREYTFLLDPPEYTAKATSPVSPATVSRVPDVKPAPGPTTSRIDNDVRARATSQARAPQPAQRSAEPAPITPEGREVRRGETLHRIASETKFEGVSLDQMLVGLFRANPDAFEGGNMNRLKAGKILSVPEKTAIETVAPGEARKIVLAQSSDWNAYRSKLAGVAARSPAQDDAGRQESAGKITAKVDDKQESAAPRDQLKVSKTEAAAKPGVTTGKKGSDEDLIAKEKALKEANERMAALEKNVADLQKLLELRNQNLAELQKQSTAKPDTVAPAQKPVEPAKPVEVPPAATPAPAVAAAPAPAPAPQAEPAKTEPSVPPAAGTPAPAAAPAQPVAAKPAEQKPAEKPKVVTPPPPREEPGFFDDLLGNPMALAGGGGILALIAAYFIARRRRSAGEAPEQDLSSTLTPPSTTSLTANSVFRSTGGQSVDTSSQTPAQTDFSQAGPGSIDTDEVDPVAEADVYMAYGRDAQAEEILLEARQKDPKRLAILLKLLEIYSGRKDVKQFETLATDLYGETGGVGPDWDKAAAMGRVLDPGNPVFRGSSSPLLGEGAQDADATLVVAPGQGADSLAMASERVAAVQDNQVVVEDQQSMVPVVAADDSADLTSLDFDLGEESKPEIVPAPADELVEDAKPSGSLDFDLGGGVQEASEFGLPEISLPEERKSVSLEETAIRVEAPDLDFDIGTQIAPVVEQLDQVEAKAESSDLSFDLGALDGPSVAGNRSSDVNATLEATALQPEDSVEFDVSLTESTFLGRPESEPASFDLSSIDLDLESPELEMPRTGVEAAQFRDSLSVQSEVPGEESFESAQVDTAVNPDFAMEQMETQVVPSGFTSALSDTAGSPDFAADQMETLIVPGVPAAQSDTVVNPDFAAQQAETIVSPSLEAVQDLVAELDVSASEEVATKLDLAKAYEEMGDLEGARELLQEVLKEGDATQREAAQNLLGKIGG